MDKRTKPQFTFFTLLALVLFGCSGCPVGMDEADGKLTAVNNSEIKILFAAKDRIDGIISWIEVNPKSEGRIAIVNGTWDNQLPNPTDSLKIYCMDFDKWEQSKGWAQVNEQTSLKYSIYTRSQLDSLGWNVVYP